MNISHVVLLDYSKAFDLVDHNIVINKLQMYGVPNILLWWIGAYFSDRRQSVRIGEDISEWLHLNGSVPQGSWFGSQLYVIMLNDLHSKGLLHKYMDDSTITEEDIDPADSIMQDDVNDIVKWSHDKNTRINGKKTKEMIISFKKKPPYFPPLKVRGVTIERVVSSKFVGIYVSSDLKWGPHFSYLYLKTNKKLYFLTRLKRAGVEENDLVEYISG